MNDDTYVYLKVKLYLKECDSEDSIRDVIEEMDYSFHHDNIISHEIRDIHDIQIPIKTNEKQLTIFDALESK